MNQPGEISQHLRVHINHQPSMDNQPLHRRSVFLGWGTGRVWPSNPYWGRYNWDCWCGVLIHDNSFVLQVKSISVKIMTPITSITQLRRQVREVFLTRHCLSSNRLVASLLMPYVKDGTDNHFMFNERMTLSVWPHRHQTHTMGTRLEGSDRFCFHRKWNICHIDSAKMEKTARS